MLVYLLFILSPIATTIGYSIYIWDSKEFSVKRLWTFAILLSLYIALLGSTKELDGDLLEYQDYFLSVPKFDFISFLISFGKEPLYYAYTYISYYIFAGNWNIYIISLTFINYILLSYSVITIGKKTNSNIRTTITALYIMAFFFQEFAANGNLVRQSLAQSLLVAFFVRYYIEDRKSWWIALCALCIHTSSLPILGIGLIPMIKRRFTIKSFSLLLLLLFIFVSIFYIIGDSLSNVPFIGYIFARANNSEQLLGQDSWQEVTGLQPAMIALLIILSYMIISIYKKTSKEKIDNNTIVMVNFNLILIITMVICNTIGAHYLLLRYFFYVYAFQCTLIAIYLNSSKITCNNIIRVALIAIIIIYFFYNFTHNTFSYIPIIDAIVYPAPVYIL